MALSRLSCLQKVDDWLAAGRARPAYSAAGSSAPRRPPVTVAIGPSRDAQIFEDSSLMTFADKAADCFGRELGQAIPVGEWENPLGADGKPQTQTDLARRNRHTRLMRFAE